MTIVETIITANGKIIVWTISVFHDAKTIKIAQMVNFVPEDRLGYVWIQKDHVRKILIVALTDGINASMTNVSKLVKTIGAANIFGDMDMNMKIIVWTISASPKQVSAKGLVAPIDPIHFYP